MLHSCGETLQLTAIKRHPGYDFVAREFIGMFVPPHLTSQTQLSIFYYPSLGDFWQTSGT